MGKIILNAVLVFFCLNCLGQAPAIVWQNTFGTTAAEGFNDIVSTFDGNYMVCSKAGNVIDGDKTVAGNVWFTKLDTSGNIIAQYGFSNIAGKLPSIIRDLKQTADSGFVVVSDLNGGAGSILDYGILKIDKNGSLQFQKQLVAQEDDIPTCVFQTLDKGFVLAGASKSPASADKSDAAITTGVFDYWIVKLDSLGNLQWDNSIGGSGTDEAFFIHQYADSTFIVAGNSSSNISGDKTSNSLGDADIWIVRLNQFGNIISQSIIGGNGAENTWAFTTNPNKELFIASASQSGISGNKTEVNFGANDYWIIKADSFANVIWENTLGGSQADQPFAIAQSPDGGCIITGISSSNISLDKSENNIGGPDYWVVKLSNTGVLQWENTIGGTLIESSRGIVVNADGSCVVAGISNSPISGDKSEANFGLQDNWVLKIAGPGPSPLPLDIISFSATKENNTSLLNWQTANMKNVLGFEIEKSKDAKLFSKIGFVKSSMESDYSFTDTKLAEKSNYYRLKIVDQDGKFTYSNVVTLLNLDKATYSVFPNPVKKDLTVSSSESNFSFHIMDMCGLVRINETSVEHSKTISCESLQKGIYFIRMEVNGYNEVLRFVKD